MTDARWLELMDGWGNLLLTGQEKAEGWHYCPDWDGLLIGPGMGEMEWCICGEPR
jgi:hypothetical protein